MKMDVKTQLHEGMKIAPIKNQEKEYTLVRSSKDNAMYGVHDTTVIKLDDLGENELDTKWICTNLSYMDEEIKCIEFAKDKWGDENKIVSFKDFCIYAFADRLEEEFESIDMRYLYMKREDYMMQKGFTYEIELRKGIQEFYEKQQNKGEAK